MRNRRVIIRRNKVVLLQSGKVKVERVGSAQTGFCFRLKIDGQPTITETTITELVGHLKSQTFASQVLEAFSMEEAPTVASLRIILPNFSVVFPTPSARY